jgi:hypothetical protein
MARVKNSDKAAVLGMLAHAPVRLADLNQAGEDAAVRMLLAGLVEMQQGRAGATNAARVAITEAGRAWLAAYGK